MGCDIHCYVEYKRKDYDRWISFGGRINPGRDYELFGYMAGVRFAVDPVAAPRGIPPDMDWQATTDWWLRVSDKYGDHEGYCSPEDAERFSRHGREIIKEGVFAKVANPDWHTPSWLTPNELDAAMTKAGAPDKYLAILAAMRSFEAQGHEVRLVFWFDN
jgi:hypothetical protein